MDYSWKSGGAQQFTPHGFKTEVALIDGGMPRVLIARGAYMDMYYIAAASGSDEISWLGTVRKKGDTFLVEEVFLFEQKVSGASTNLEPTDVAAVATDLIQRGELEKVNNIKFWGHVHPGNSTSPSGQDESQMDVFRDGNDWFLRGIFGRNGRAEFTLLDYSRGMRFNDVPWELFVPDSAVREAEIKAQVAQKVKSTPMYTPPAYGYGGCRPVAPPFFGSY